MKALLALVIILAPGCVGFIVGEPDAEDSNRDSGLRTDAGSASGLDAAADIDASELPDAGASADASGPSDAGNDAGEAPDASSSVDFDAGLPDGCAPLLRIGLGVYYVKDSSNQIVSRMASADNPAIVGDFIVMNSTPRIASYPGDTRGVEQPYECVDPNGPIWMLSLAGVCSSCPINVKSNPYLSQFTASWTGDYLITACPRSGVGTCGQTTAYVR
jgi:hypothetical protein